MPRPEISPAIPPLFFVLKAVKKELKAVLNARAGSDYFTDIEDARLFKKHK